MRERAVIEGVMRLCAWNTCKKWSMPDSAAYTFINSMVAELAALPTPPAEPEEVSEAMIEAGMIVEWLLQQAAAGAGHGLAADKGTTRRAAFGGGSLALKRAAEATAAGEHRAARPAADNEGPDHAAG